MKDLVYRLAITSIAQVYWLVKGQKGERMKYIVKGIGFKGGIRDDQEIELPSEAILLGLEHEIPNSKLHRWPGVAGEIYVAILWYMIPAS